MVVLNVVWFVGGVLMLLAHLVAYELHDASFNEVVFRIVMWPLFLLLTIIVGGINTWRRLLRSL